MSRPDHPDTLNDQWLAYARGTTPMTPTAREEKRCMGAFFVGAAWIYDEVRQALEDNDPTRIDGILRSVARDIQAYQDTLGEGDG